ncbi:gamma-glutamyl-gamma-aminobutyrate hydrolase family protein [Natranaerofaba carboxydovora]|uniref:gamma-glutamyl-gamma-aminobutyrate hydrolase family protein n=1 Tax=Natranaerofaba carboxydovora TaxID=2742683 RepID=UPI001F144ACF|nr:gamma-glutamyl-gamma-aminobutyrate hydrolase family protein [Natranaerofaba carboxydovora]UMZ75005.1 Putative glutamine amidotransferase [Natranaerofaba carboxydovora]
MSSNSHLLVGLTCREENDKNRISLNYTKVIEKLGLVPILIPSLSSMDAKKGLLKHLSGLILTGGVDVDPVYFGEEPLLGQGEIEPLRDKLEIFLTRKALDKNLPLLGICRGMQVLNIAAGGDIYQDIYSQLDNTLKHEQIAPGRHPTHGIDIQEDTKLYQITGKKNIRVNSFHHQAIRNIAPGFVESAKSPDGIVEGMESTMHSFALAVQWHPELLWEVQVESNNVFNAFVEAVKLNG